MAKVQPPKMPIWLERKIRGQMKRRRRLQAAIERAVRSDNINHTLELSRQLQEVVDDIGVHVHQALAIDGSKQAATVLPALNGERKRSRG